MGVSHEAAWPVADNPRHLLRLSRVHPNGRKYLLLASRDREGAGDTTEEACTVLNGGVRSLAVAARQDALHLFGNR